MNTEAALVAFEEAIAQQTALGDERLEEVAAALVAALRSAGERLALTLAAEAAAEVSAQLPDAEVRVVIESGEPVLMVVSTEAEDEAAHFNEDLEARLTLRLPAGLKGLLEDAAGDAGDSVNAHVVETLSKAIHRHRRSAGSRFSGTIET